MGKGMEGVVGIHSELFRGNKHGAGGTQADVAATLSHHAGADSGSGVIAGTGGNLNGGGNAQSGGDFRLYGTDTLVAFEELGHLRFRDAAEVQHFLAPALMLHVQQQHAGGIGIITGMNTGEDIVYIIFWQHDLGNLAEVFRLLIPNPEDLGGGEAGKGNIGRPGRQGLLADDIVQIIHLTGGTAVVPENGGTDHTVLPIQDHQAVHLAAAADPGHQAAVEAPEQLRNALQNGLFPVLGSLLTPAGLREFQRIFFGDNILNVAVFVHQQKLHRRSTKVNSNEEFHIKPPVHGSIPAHFLLLY